MSQEDRLATGFTITVDGHQIRKQSYPRINRPMKTIKVDGVGDLRDAAEEILESLERRTIVAFRGEMGAGKTTLIREICEQLGVTDTVTSPTFAIVNEYKDRDMRPIYHFDFYRINRIEEAFDFGYEEYFYSGNLCLVEWPEKIEPLMPEEGVMTVRIEVTGEEDRVISID